MATRKIATAPVASVSNHAKAIAIGRNIADKEADIRQALADLPALVKVHGYADTSLDYQIGHMAVTLNVSDEEATRVRGLTTNVGKRAVVPDTTKSIAQQEAYNNAVSSWAHWAKKLGIANPKPRAPGAGKKATKPAPAKVAEPDNSVPLDSKAVRVPHATTRTDVIQTLQTVAALLHKFETKNAKVLDGDTRPIIGSFISSVRALAKK